MAQGGQKCNLLSLLIEGVTDDDGPYRLAFLAYLFFSISTFVVSTVTKNYSQVDKLWSIVPFLYTWMAVGDGRTLLMAILATTWGIRLTTNFYRRGGYKWPPWAGEEDYRWELVQKGHYLQILTNPFVWSIFNLSFISFYQMMLLLLITGPSFVSLTLATDPYCKSEIYVPLNHIDGIATLFFFFFLVVESVADDQQYGFQTKKYKQKEAGTIVKGSEYDDGFTQSGLFAILRKPNYAAEQSIWITFYMFSVAATGGTLWWNWSLVGSVLLVLLFQGSGNLTEKITLGKYPKYAEYMTRVPRYIPFTAEWTMTTKKKGSEKSD